MTALPSHTSTWSNGVLSKSYNNLIPEAYLRVQIINSMPRHKKILKQCSPWLAEKENLSIFNSNSYLEMLWKEICFVGPINNYNGFSLHYFIVDVFSIHCTSDCIFYITTQNSIFRRIMFRTNRFITIQN